MKVNVNRSIIDTDGDWRMINKTCTRCTHSTNYWAVDGWGL